MGVSKQNSKLNGGLGVTEGLAEGRAAGEIQNKKVMERHSGCGGAHPGEVYARVLTFVCNLASCFSSRLVCL